MYLMFPEQTGHGSNSQSSEKMLRLRMVIAGWAMKIGSGQMPSNMYATMISLEHVECSAAHTFSSSTKEGSSLDTAKYWNFWRWAVYRYWTLPETSVLTWTTGRWSYRGSRCRCPVGFEQLPPEWNLDIRYLLQGPWATTSRFGAP